MKVEEFTSLVLYITGLNSGPIFAGFSCVFFPMICQLKFFML